MEQSKLISEVIAKLKVAYTSYFKNLKSEEFIGLVGMYQEQLVGYRLETFMKAIDEIIKTSKFMPTVAEILEHCKSCESSFKNEIIEKMIADGYFKDPREIDKTYKFMEEGIIPRWLLEDMKKYGYVEYESLPNSELKQLGSGKNELV